MLNQPFPMMLGGVLYTFNERSNSSYTLIRLSARAVV